MFLKGITGEDDDVNVLCMFQEQKMSVHRRFYTALALHDLVNEIPLPVVARKFGCSRGMLQSLQQSASTFAGIIILVLTIKQINLRLSESY